MRTKNSKSLTAKERDWMLGVKSLPCSVCDLHGPSDAHHIKQGQTFTIVALCKECHQGAHNGWHGRKAMWAIKKMDDVDALAVTIERMFA